MNKTILTTLPLLIAPGLGACATYPQRTAVALHQFETGDFEAASISYADQETTGSAFLSSVEAGMAALTVGDWGRAQDLFHAAAGEVRELEERALVSAQSLGEVLLSWTVNEGVKAYQGEGYERVALHASLAMTYLAQGELDGVWVEVQLANRLLDSEEQLYEKKYAAGGLGHFVSALAYELHERPDEAYIDYRRMVEKNVGTEIAGRALVRLAHELRYTDDLEKWVARFGAPTDSPEGVASIVVIAGLGLAPFKKEASLTIPTPDGLLRWAVPQFVARPQTVKALEVEVVGGVVRTSLLEDVSAVAAENLADRIAWLAAKSTVRTILKRELTKNLEDRFQGLGWVAGALITLATERADLRSWQTLPGSWHAGRLFVEPGRHPITVTAIGGRSVSLGSYELDPGETMILIARTLGGRLYVHPIGGLRIAEQATAAP